MALSAADGERAHAAIAREHEHKRHDTDEQAEAWQVFGGEERAGA